MKYFLSPICQHETHADLYLNGLSIGMSVEAWKALRSRVDRITAGQLVVLGIDVRDRVFPDVEQMLLDCAQRNC